MQEAYYEKGVKLTKKPSQGPHFPKVIMKHNYQTVDMTNTKIDTHHEKHNL